MAKRRTISDAGLFKPTEDQPSGRGAGEGVPSTGYTRPVSVGLKESELELLDAHAERLGVARNALMRFMIRYGLELLEKDELRVPIEDQRKTSIKMP